MAENKKEYIAKAIPVEITATSRCAVKIRDNYYTVEATEKRSLHEEDIGSQEYIDMDAEWKALFDEVNRVVDEQCEDIVRQFKK